MTTTGPPRAGASTRAAPAGDDQSALASRRGIPWWAAVAVAVVFTGVGVGIDLARGGTLTLVFLLFYAGGCVLAALAVMHRGLFAAMVQPPLILAFAVPLVVKLLGGGGGGGLRSQLLMLALPLVNGFPTMAFTTAATVGIGVVRIVVRRRSAAPVRHDGPGAEHGTDHPDAQAALRRGNHRPARP